MGELYFEGPEKKVELVVSPKGPPLRSLGTAWWASVVAKADAKILSKVSNEDCDAYLLSESSLFVYDDRVLMFTCGRTTLAKAVVKMLERIPSRRILSLIYERKNELFPHYQRSSFYTDAALLDRRLRGRALRFGPQDEHHVYLFHLRRPYDPEMRDTTLEILMHDISPRARDIFCSGSRHNLSYIQSRTDVREIFPGFQVDDHLFRPMGYSLNAIRRRHYYTVHVTPEESGSYVSFETNVPLGARAYGDTLEKVLSIFEPRTFDLVLFQMPARSGVPARLGYSSRGESSEYLGCGYEVRYQRFHRPQKEPSPAFEVRFRR